jgi:hypothetical protein
VTDRTATHELLQLLAACASHLGRELGPISEKHLVTRLAETDADLVREGVEAGLLRIEGNYLRTRDPRQATAWLVEGNPAHPCWEYIPHAAAYVELIATRGLPAGSVRFETPESEVGMSLDLVVVDSGGRAVVLGEVKMEIGQIQRLAAGLAEHAQDPDKPAPVRAGGPRGIRREAWKLAHQLWQTRAPYLWLVAAGRRSAYRVMYGHGLVLEPLDDLPGPEHLSVSLAQDWPALRLPGNRAV